MSIDGIAKHWILSSRSEMKDMGGCIVEEKSQNLDLPSTPLSLSSYCYQGTHCTVLVVCREMWQVGAVIQAPPTVLLWFLPSCMMLLVAR